MTEALGMLRMGNARGVDDATRALLEIAVARAAPTGGTLDVLYNGRTLTLEVGAGETVEQVAQRLSDAIDETEGWCSRCGLRHRFCRCGHHDHLY